MSERICHFCGEPTSDWVDPDWSSGPICRLCESKHDPSAKSKSATELLTTLRDLKLWLERHLQTTHARSGPISAPKLNGYAVIEIPDWEMRQKLESLSNCLPVIETFTAERDQLKAELSRLQSCGEGVTKLSDWSFEQAQLDQIKDTPLWRYVNLLRAELAKAKETLGLAARQLATFDEVLNLSPDISIAEIRANLSELRRAIIGKEKE